MESRVDAGPPTGAAAPSALRRRIIDPLMALLGQGVTPERLSVAIAVGAAVGVFPILGTTTAICAAIALGFRLNVVAVQAGNYLVFPLQFVLLLPFMRLGERVLGTPPLPMNAVTVAATFQMGLWHALHALSGALWHAAVGWAAVAPVAALVLAVVLRPVLRRTDRALAARRFSARA